MTVAEATLLTALTDLVLAFLQPSTDGEVKTNRDALARRVIEARHAVTAEAFWKTNQP